MLASSESKWSLKGNMMNLGGKEMSLQERRSAWWGRVGWARGVLMVKEKHGIKLRGPNPGEGVPTEIEQCLSSSIPHPSRAASTGEGVELVLATGRGSDRNNCLVWFQNCPNTRPAMSWWANPVPLPVDQQLLKDLAWPVSSNLQCCVSGFSIYGRI